MYVYTYVYIYIYIYVCVCVCVCMYVCIYTGLRVNPKRCQRTAIRESGSTALYPGKFFRAALSFCGVSCMS